MREVVLYTTTYCGACRRAKQLLDQKGVVYKEINVEQSASLRTEMREKAGGHNSVPQIFIGGEHVGGCDDLYSLEADQQLDEKLQLT